MSEIRSFGDYTDYTGKYNNNAGYSSVSKIETNQNDYINQNDLLKKLQQKNPKLSITVGNSDINANTAKSIEKTDVRIAPEILDKMKNDSQIAAKYENMLSKIPALDKWADSMIKSMTGSDVKYRQVWIDKDGNMGSMCITGPSESQKKNDADKKIKEKKDYEKILAKRKEERKKNKDKLKDTHMIFATGTDIKSITEDIVAQTRGTKTLSATLDIKV